MNRLIETFDKMKENHGVLGAFACIEGMTRDIIKDFNPESLPDELAKEISEAYEYVVSQHIHYHELEKVWIDGIYLKIVNQIYNARTINKELKLSMGDEFLVNKIKKEILKHSGYKSISVSVNNLETLEQKSYNLGLENISEENLKRLNYMLSIFVDAECAFLIMTIEGQDKKMKCLKNIRKEIMSITENEFKILIKESTLNKLMNGAKFEEWNI